MTSNGIGERSTQKFKEIKKICGQGNCTYRQQWKFYKCGKMYSLVSNFLGFQNLSSISNAIVYSVLQIIQK